MPHNPRPTGEDRRKSCLARSGETALLRHQPIYHHALRRHAHGSGWDCHADPASGSPNNGNISAKPPPGTTDVRPSFAVPSDRPKLVLGLRESAKSPEMDKTFSGPWVIHRVGTPLYHIRRNLLYPGRRSGKDCRRRVLLFWSRTEMDGWRRRTVVSKFWCSRHADQYSGSAGRPPRAT